MSTRSGKMAGLAAMLAIGINFLVPGRGMAGIGEVVLGGPGYSPVIGDYTGDGKADPTVYHPADGTWFVSVADYDMVSWTGFGDNNSIPIMGDYDGDGKADPGIYNAVASMWTIRLSDSGYAPITLSFGGPGQQALLADFDGDGKADPAVYQESTGNWMILLSSASYTATSLPGFLGGAGWKAVGADFDGDGKADPAVYQESTGDWLVKHSINNTYTPSYYPGLLGGPGYQALGGDLDGNGTANYIVYQESSGIWKILGYAGILGRPWVLASEGTYPDKVRVTWNAISNATSYEVWRNTVDNSDTAAKRGEPTTTTFDDTSVTAGAIYYYWIKAKNADTTGGFSRVVSGWLQSTPVPISVTIEANNSEGPIILGREDALAVTVQLYPAGYTGTEVDWWVVASTPMGWYYLNSSFLWTASAGGLASIQPVHQGELFNLQPMIVLNLTDLPVGSYTFWFAVDSPMDGILNVDGTILVDSATVTVQ